MVDSLASAEDRDNYYIHLYRSYVERSRNRKWCLAPGCDRAIEFDSDMSESYDVACDCSHNFCWKCAEDSHHPVDCKTVAEWLRKNVAEAMSTNWIIAHTKPCPECRRPIQKIEGEFCWVCLGPCEGQGANTFKCSEQYKWAEMEIVNRRILKAEKSLETHEHLCERWDTNERLRRRALVSLDRAKRKWAGRVGSGQGEIEEAADELQLVITETWEQIVECRRVLKWSYAYEYFLSEDDRNLGKMKFLVCLREAMKLLHQCLVKKIDINNVANCEVFRQFRLNLAPLTLLTRNFLKILVVSLENDLSEVEPHQSCSYEESPLKESIAT